MMSVTSIFSAGYLQPNSQSQALNKIYEDERIRQEEALKAAEAKQADLARKQQEILSQEKALKARAGQAEVQTVYQYSLGEDGRRYITGASVTIAGDQEDVTRVGGGVTSREVRIEANQDDDQALAAAIGDDEANESAASSYYENPTRSSDSDDEPSTSASAGGNDELSASEQAQINQLKRAETEVKAHEAAHKAVAGQFGGSISYTYTEGPDGKRYITGGEVPIQMKEGATPEETVRNMQQVQRAAQAPASPSGQDRQVAAQAAAKAAKAQSEANAKRAEKLSGESKNDKAGKIDKTDKSEANKSKKAEPTRANRSENNKAKSNHVEPMTTMVAEGTPMFDQDEPDEADPSKVGVSKIVAEIRESEITGFKDQNELAA